MTSLCQNFLSFFQYKGPLVDINNSLHGHLLHGRL